MMNIGMNSICRNSEILPQAFTNEILVEEDLGTWSDCMLRNLFANWF